MSDKQKSNNVLGSIIIVFFLLVMTGSCLLGATLRGVEASLSDYIAVFFGSAIIICLLLIYGKIGNVGD